MRLWGHVPTRFLSRWLVIFVSDSTYVPQLLRHRLGCCDDELQIPSIFFSTYEDKQKGICHISTSGKKQSNGIYEFKTMVKYLSEVDTYFGTEKVIMY